MSPRSIPLVVAAVVMAAVGGWLLLAEDHGEPPAPFPGGDSTGAAVAPGPPGDPEARDARVRIEVRRVGGLVRSPGDPNPRCRLIEAGRAVPCMAQVVAGAGNRPGAPGRYLVRFVMADGSSLWRLVTLGDAVTDVERFAANVIAGQVVDDLGRPVAGAEVWTGASDASGPILAMTGEDGSFVVNGVAATRGVPVTVRAPGLASHWRAVDLDRAQERPLLLQLAPASVLEILVIDGSVPSSDLRIEPRSDDLELRHYPFFWDVVDPRPDARSVVRISDLPRGSRVGVGVAPWFSSAIVEARLREQAVRVVLPPAKGRITGRVTDSDGAPQSAARVSVRPPTRTSAAGFLLPLRGPRERPVASDGTFTVAVPEATAVELVVTGASSTIGVSVVGRAGADLGDIVLRPVVDGATPGVPAVDLRLEAAGERRWRAELTGLGELRWRDAETVTIVLPESCVVDVDVRARGPSGDRHRTWRGLPVVGPTPLTMVR